MEYNPSWEYKTTEMNLPFYHYRKVVTIDRVSGKVVGKDKKLIPKTTSEIYCDAVIVGVSAAAINGITNGISHLIYAIKKKKGAK